MTHRIARGIREGLAELPPDPSLLLDRTRMILGTPVLRARLWENNHATRQVKEVGQREEESDAGDSPSPRARLPAMKRRDASSRRVDERGGGAPLVEDEEADEHDSGDDAGDHGR
ncbi:hypothetical protein [Actinomadura geliboluensis]|uniref:hypothetical protein n=1 Tax=Actinomadura geliboluensis TaxID=882440 RepID=UPI0036877A9B